MPLINSPSEHALRQNIATEINAGKPPAQAAAIAYSVQRQADTLPMQQTAQSHSDMVAWSYTRGNHAR